MSEWQELCSRAIWVTVGIFAVAINNAAALM